MSGANRRSRAVARDLPITREMRGGQFVYRLRGRPITRAVELKRIEPLAIPPAWSDVAIAGARATKVLAQGIDAAGRVQTIYHPSFRRKQDKKKFERLRSFARAASSARGGRPRYGEANAK